MKKPIAKKVKAAAPKIKLKPVPSKIPGNIAHCPDCGKQLEYATGKPPDGTETAYLSCNKCPYFWSTQSNTVV